MCGIVGFISKQQGGLFSRDLDLIETMLLFNTVRGRDSTGVFAQRRNGEIIGMKTATHALHMTATDQWSEFRAQAIKDGKFVVGHGRAATRGSVKNENAHPFIENNIILVHNGTLRETKNISDVSTEVDSHAIAHALTENPVKDVISELNGAFALVWFDTDTNLLHAVRNDERPLVIVEVTEGYIICSEDWIGAVPCIRQSRHIMNRTEVPPGMLFTWDSNKRVMAMSTEQVSLRQHSWRDDAAWGGMYGHPHTPSHVSTTATRTTTPTKSAVEAEQQREEKPEANLTGGSVTPEITRLRAALTAQAKDKEAATSSNVCALTRKGDGTAGLTQTTMTPRLTPSDEAIAEERTASIRVLREDFRKGEIVMIKILSINPGNTVNGRIKYTGKIREVGKEMLDVCGFLPRDVSVTEMSKYMEGYWCGLVNHVNFTTNGGPYVFMQSDIFPVTMEEVHGDKVPSTVWFKAHDHMKCDGCARKVFHWERNYTSVRLKGKHGEKTQSGGPLNVVEMTCPNCVANKMTAGTEFKQKFLERYEQARKDHNSSANSDSSVSDGKPLSPSTVRTDGKLIELPGPTTLQ